MNVSREKIGPSVSGLALPSAVSGFGSGESWASRAESLFQTRKSPPPMPITSTSTTPMMINSTLFDMPPPPSLMSWVDHGSAGSRPPGRLSYEAGGRERPDPPQSDCEEDKARSMPRKGRIGAGQAAEKAPRPSTRRGRASSSRPGAPAGSITAPRCRRQGDGNSPIQSAGSQVFDVLYPSAQRRTSGRAPRGLRPRGAGLPPAPVPQGRQRPEGPGGTARCAGSLPRPVP